ncbi:MAG: alpha-glucosidase [Clostridiaceae bacterium]
MKKKWWDKSVVYQIYPKSFYDSNNDGIGDIKGIIEKLDYLKELGIDVIWLSPVYKSPMIDNGYDISDYYNIASQFGSMKDMENLIEEAKNRDIKIIMDLVINHTSDMHPWFIEARSSKDNLMRDYYIWKDPKEDGSEPNNWESVFGGSAWEYDSSTAQYYLHSFAKEQPDLNWESKIVREDLFKMVRYWLDKGIGGFRVDAITHIKKENSFKDIKPKKGEKLVSICEACLNADGIEKFLAELKEEAFSKYDILTVAEAPGVPKERLHEYSGEHGYFDLLFEFEHVGLDVGEDDKWYNDTDWTLLDFKKEVSKSQEIFNEIGLGALFLENHDLPRSLSRFFKEEEITSTNAKMLALSFFFLKGIPFIYQGQEIGMTNVKYNSIEDYDDLASIDQYNKAISEGLSKEKALAGVYKRSRDNARTPMQWDSNMNAGFSMGNPWIKINDNFKEINVESNLKDKNSIFYFYKRLVDLKKNSEYSDLLAYGRYTEVMEDDKNIFAYIREYNGKKLLIICNFINSELGILLNYKIKDVVISNYEEFNFNKNKILVKPYQGLVLEIL